jgi:chromatin assembly factor 1 subunit A
MVVYLHLACILQGEGDDSDHEDDEDEDGFFVPHGYLSEGEGAESDEDEASTFFY